MRIWTAADTINGGANYFRNHFRIELNEAPPKLKEYTLDLDKIVSDLTAEKDRIFRAIEALLQAPSKRGPKKGVKRQPAMAQRRGGITPEGRRRLSLAMKKRWAERKRKKS